MTSLAASLLAGCSYFFGPKASPSKVEVKDERLACMRDLAKKDLDQQLDCAITAMEKFESNTRGQRADGWSVSELESFVSNYLGKNPGERSAWVSEGLKWKSALLGGEDGRISREEFKSLREMMVRLKPTLVQLNPYRHLILFSSEKAASADVERAVSALAAATSAVEQELIKVSRSGVVRKPLPLSAISTSATAVGLGEASTLKSTLSFLPLAGAVKGLLLGGDENTLAPNDWSELVHWGGKFWGLALRMRYQVKGNNRILAEDLGVVEKAMSETDEILLKALRTHGEKGIPRDRLERVVTELEARALLPVNLRASTLNSLLPQLLSKLLHGNSRADKTEKAAVLSLSQEQVLMSAVRDWLAGQRMLNRALAGRDAGAVDLLARAIAQSPAAGRDEFRAKEQLTDLLVKGRPLPFDDEGRLIVKKRELLPELRRTDLERLNLSRAVAALLLRGYTHNADAAEKTSGLTEAETQELYLDIRSVGLELHLVDPRNDTAGTRTFMEANIFLSVSNGDNLVSLHEAVEWFHIIFSGACIADRMLEALNATSGISGSSDVFGRQLLDTKRFRTEFARLVAERFRNLPGLSEWWGRSDAKTVESAVQFIEKAGRSAGNADAPIDTADLRNFGPILHYVESLFVRFDANSTETLESSELWRAFPLVQPLILQLSGGLAVTEDLQKAIFSWLVVFGEPPKVDLLGGAKIIGWSLARHVVNETADRLDVLKVMGAIGTASREARVKKIGDFWKTKSREQLRAEIAARESGTVSELTALFQCLPTAADTLGADLKHNIDYLFPRGKSVDVESFISGVKSVIAVDQRLNNLCLPF